MKSRVGYIDSLKGIAIILVIVGHIIQYYYSPEAFRGNCVFRYIYSFHMALFMALSGYTVNNNFDSIRAVFAKIDRRAINLLLPFICWGLFDNFFLGGAPLSQLFIRSDLGLWFLHALFFIYSIFLLVTFPVRGYGKKVNYIVLLTTSIALTIIDQYNAFSFDTYWVAKHFPSFCIGYIIADYKDFVMCRKNFWYVFFMIPLFFLSVLLQRVYDNDILCHIFFSTPYQMLIELLAILSLFMLSFRYQSKLKFYGFEFIGKLTLGIYAVHQPIIKKITCILETGVENYPYKLLFSGGIFLFVLFLSIAIVKIIENSKFLSLVLLGKNCPNI